GWVGRNVGVDAALLLQLDGEQPADRTELGLGVSWSDEFVGRLGGRYRSDYDAILSKLASGRFMTGATSRLETWAGLRGRQGLEEEMMFPLNLKIGSGGLISVRGQTKAVLLLARSGAVREFTVDEGNLLSNAAPVFALGLALHERR